MIAEFHRHRAPCSIRPTSSRWREGKWTWSGCWELKGHWFKAGHIESFWRHFCNVTLSGTRPHWSGRGRMNCCAQTWRPCAKNLLPGRCFKEMKIIWYFYSQVSCARKGEELLTADVSHVGLWCLHQPSGAVRRAAARHSEPLECEGRFRRARHWSTCCAYFSSHHQVIVLKHRIHSCADSELL